MERPFCRSRNRQSIALSAIGDGEFGASPRGNDHAPLCPGRSPDLPTQRHFVPTRWPGAGLSVRLGDQRGRAIMVPELTDGYANRPIDEDFLKIGQDYPTHGDYSRAKAYLPGRGTALPS